MERIWDRYVRAILGVLAGAGLFGDKDECRCCDMRWRYATRMFIGCLDGLALLPFPMMATISMSMILAAITTERRFRCDAMRCGSMCVCRVHRLPPANHIHATTAISTIEPASNQPFSSSFFIFVVAMAKDKLSVNPALAQHKREKNKLVRKGKAEAVARRDEKLARRNPEQIRRLMQQLKPDESERLEELKKELQAVEKARKTLGRDGDGDRDRDADKGGGRGRDRDREAPGKRRREDGDHAHRHDQHHPSRRRKFDRHDENSDTGASDTDESVRNIPMPRDTPPPVPREFGRRRREKDQQHGDAHADSHEDRHGAGDAQKEPQPEKRQPAPTVFEARPQLRNIQREVVQGFIPAAVARQQQQQQQQQRQGRVGRDGAEQKEQQQAKVEDVDEDESAAAAA